MRLNIFSKSNGTKAKLSQLKKNVISGSVLAGGNILLLLIAYPVYLKYLGAEQYGMWASLSVIVFFSQLGEGGIGSALIKHVAGEFGKGNSNGITQYTTTSFYILIIPSLIILSILFLFKSQIITFLGLKPSYASQAQLLIPLIGCLSVFIMFADLIRGSLMGVGRVDMANYVFLVGRIIQVGGSIVLIIGGLGVLGLYFGTVLSYIFTVTVYLYILYFRYKISIFRINSFSKKHFNNLLVFGGALLSARLVSILMGPFNKVIIAKYIGLTEVTFYELAFKGAVSLRSLYEMGLKAIMPKVSELQQEVHDLIKTIRNIHRQSINFILIFGLPAFFGLFILAKFVLVTWLGDSYDSQIKTALRWFLLAYAVNLFSVPSYYILVGLNKVNLCFYAASIRSFAHSGIVLYLIFASFPVTFELLIVINTLAVIASASFIMIMYHFKLEQYVIQQG